MTAIMQIGDYISSKTVRELTPDQYLKFREYLRSHGFSVDDEHGAYEKATMYTYELVYLDRWGDLIWRRASVISSGREITVDEIFKAIQTNDEDFVMTTVQAPNTHDIQQIDCLIAHHQAVIEELTRKRIEMEIRDAKYSLGQAFLVIGNAITNPNTNIPIIDHRNTKHDHLVLAESIILLIEKLDLKNFHVNKSKLVIRYCIPPQN